LAVPASPCPPKTLARRRWKTALTALAACFVAPMANAYISFDTDDGTLLLNAPNDSRAAWSFMQPGPGMVAVLSFPLDMLPAGTTADNLDRAVVVLSVITIKTGGSLEVLLLPGT
jgi:hypothetical protein